jgi:asparagine synthase (glutamine-hydrolysing)
MSGIFGVLDPDGPIGESILRAASVSSFRGKAEVHIERSVAFGAWRHDHDPDPFFDRGDARLVAVAFIDATIQGTAADRIEQELVSKRAPGISAGLDLLDGLLDMAGPAALDGVAGDFALARFVDGRLTLARDAVGMLPLFWARKGRRFGFASDPEMLVALGLAPGDLDPLAVAAFLSSVSPPAGTSPFAGVRRVCGGRWVTYESNSAVRGGRWFRPESVAIDHDVDLDQAAEEARRLVVQATADRVRRSSSVYLSLTGGRDSGSIAVALADIGAPAKCFTLVPDASLGIDESPLAAGLAAQLRLSWQAMPVSSRPKAADLDRVPDLQGPFGPPVFPVVLATNDLIEDASPGSVLLDGLGGDPLFHAHPVVSLDLLRQGRPWAAIRAAASFRDHISPFVQGKTLLRAVAPDAVVRSRLALDQEIPPWVAGAIPRIDPRLAAPRSDSDWLRRNMIVIGESDVLEQGERQVQPLGMRYGAPLFDLRVVRFALTLPPRLRTPIEGIGSKPVLGRGLLGNNAQTRIKALYRPYMQRLARNLRTDFPDLITGGMLSKSASVRVEGLTSVADPRLEDRLLPLVPLELWLRKTMGDHG